MADRPLGDIVSEQRWTYIARKPDGEVCCVTAIDPRWANDTRKAVSKWLKEGLTIERVPVEWARQFLFTREPYQPLKGKMFP